jgi:hypothetical protein
MSVVRKASNQTLRVRSFPFFFGGRSELSSFVLKSKATVPKGRARHSSIITCHLLPAHMPLNAAGHIWRFYERHTGQQRLDAGSVLQVVEERVEVNLILLERSKHAAITAFVHPLLHPVAFENTLNGIA